MSTRGSTTAGSATTRKAQTAFDRLTGLWTAEREWDARLDATFAKESQHDTYMRNARALAARLAGSQSFNRLAQSIVRGMHGAGLEDLKRPGERAVANLLITWARGPSQRTPLHVAMLRAIEAEFDLPRANHVADVVTERAAERRWGTYQPGLRAYARVQYEATQEWLRSQHVQSVPLWRGMAWDEGNQPTGKQWDGRVHSFRQVWPSVISMSTKAALSNGFTMASGERRQYAQLSLIRVPANRIFSTAATGVGEKGEREVVVLGGQFSGKVLRETAASLDEVSEMFGRRYASPAAFAGLIG